MNVFEVDSLIYFCGKSSGKNSNVSLDLILSIFIFLNCETKEQYFIRNVCESHCGRLNNMELNCKYILYFVCVPFHFLANFHKLLALSKRFVIYFVIFVLFILCLLT